MSSHPESPIKQTLKKLLSPNKSKPTSSQPALTPQFPEHTNWTYPESTSSSNYSADSNIQYNTGWNVLERPQTPTSGANKENVFSTKDVVERVMGPSKLSKQKSKQLSKEADLDRQFEELMNSRSIPSELRCKLRSVDESVKKHMLKNHSSLSQTKSPSRLFRHGNNTGADLLSSPKKAKKYTTISAPTSPVKAHPAAIFTQGKVWDMEMQSVADVRAYFCGVKVNEIDVGMVKKLWQLLRNESMQWISQFLMEDGFGVILNVLKDILAIEWRDEKDDAILHQILLCLKALSTTDPGLRELSNSSSTLFPLLIKNLFSDKQPTEFSTRLLIPTLLHSHLSAHPETSRTILAYLTDPAPESKPHDFLLEGYTPRPYKKWYSEINSVCRDVFWIFLHPKNIIALTEPTDAPFPHSAKITVSVPSGFKGGVEWCATEYLGQHIALINVILSGLTREEGMTVRRDLRNCGFEGVMGGKLRKASKEYYPGLHAELQRWCWEGYKDDWMVFDVARGFDEGTGSFEEAENGAPVADS